MFYVDALTKFITGSRRHPWAELEIAKREGKYEEEGWRLRKDGSRFWANVLITALRDEENRLRGFAKVTRDITERRQREQERAANESLEQQRRFLKDVLRSVTEGRLILCDSPADLPDPLPPVPPALVSQSELLPLTRSTLQRVRHRVADVASASGIPQVGTRDLTTAASECAMNAIQHGGGGNVRVLGNVDIGKVQVWVEDRGSGIDLSDLPRATLESGFSAGKGGIGHGFSLMIACCHRVYLLTGANGTTVVLEQARYRPEPTWLLSRKYHPEEEDVEQPAPAEQTEVAEAAEVSGGQEASREVGMNRPMEQMGTDAMVTADERVESGLSLGRERPDLSEEFFNPDHPQATTPYLVTRAREIPLERKDGTLSGGGAQSGSAVAGGPSIALVLALTGELDLLSAKESFYPLLNRALAEFSNMSATPRVVILGIDLSQLDFIDSAGLKEMIDLRRRTANLPGRLVVAAGPAETQVEYAWKLGKFDTFILTRSTMEEAIAVAIAELDT